MAAQSAKNVASPGFNSHNHKQCIERAVNYAQESCHTRGLQFTTIRQRVLEILLNQHKAMGAYDILDQLKKEGFNSQPPVAYRALDFLVQHGFAHKIERLNAFIACHSPESDHTPTFFICRVCSAVVETQPELARGALGKTAKDVGFLIEQTVVEVEGVCPNCR
jgi:Fur family transcriptional regulator, zinc uptake regulator